MACGSFLSHRFDNPYITIPAYTIAFGVGVGRMVDRRHWNSDTIRGAILGYAVGKEVAQRSVERRQREDADKPLTETGGLFLGGDGQAFTVGWKMTF